MPTFVTRTVCSCSWRGGVGRLRLYAEVHMIIDWWVVEIGFDR